MEKKKDIIGTLSKGLTIAGVVTTLGIGAYCVKEGKPIVEVEKQSPIEEVAGAMHDQWVASGSDCRDRKACVKTSARIHGAARGYYRISAQNVVLESAIRHGALMNSAGKEQE